MDWGIEIWDQFENVDRHLHHGIEYSDRYMKFVQERSSIEQDYAKQLRRLVKKYQPKKKDDECGIFSTHKAFQSQLSELNDIAGQHEVVAESLMKSVVKTLQAFVTEMRAEKKKSYQEGRHLQAQLDSFERALEQTKRKFEKEWRESERATANYEKLDADVNVTKAEVDKARQASIAKKDSVESCKGDYASMLTKFNQEQSEHFHTHMPKVFENFRDMEERRINKLSEMMGEFATIDTNVKPIVSKCLEGMKRAAEAVDANLDSKLVVEKFKSGFYPPNDKEFEDYTVPQQHLTANEDDKHLNSPRNSMNLAKSKDKKGLSWLFGGKKSRAGNKTVGAKPMRHSHSENNLDSESPAKSNSLDETKESTKNNKAEAAPTANVAKSKTLAPSTRDYVNVDIQPLNDNANESTKSPVKLREKRRSTSSADSEKTSVRASINVGRKKLLSMFKEKPQASSKPPQKPPRKSVKISAPIVSNADMSMMPSAGEYMIPVKEGDKMTTAAEGAAADENPYTEVNFSEDEFTDDSQDTDTPGIRNLEKNPESADYSHLPPEQRKKKLQKHIDELRGQHAKEIDGRNAILKMQDVYRANPAMGDAGSLEMQLKNSNESIAKLEADLNQYETWYAEASGGAPPRPAPAGGSVHQQQPQQSPNKPQYTQPLKSGPTQKKPSLQHEESFADEFEEDGEAVGSCVALFDFSANSEGAMSMKEGDKFTVLEADKGDGWTRVMKDNADGYVPTSYLEVQFY